MRAEHWIAVAVILSNLLAPLLATLVHFQIRAARPEGEKRRRKTDRHGGSTPTTEMALMCLPFVLALSLDIYVVRYQTGQSGVLFRSDLINGVALVMGGLQVLAMAALAGLNVLRARDKALATALTDLRDQQAEMKETFRVGLEEIVTSVAELSDGQAAIHGRFATTERGLLKSHTKARDEQAAIQRKTDAREKVLLTAFSKALAEQAAAYEESLRQSRAANQTPKALDAQTQETLPKRKADLRRRFDASS